MNTEKRNGQAPVQDDTMPNPGDPSATARRRMTNWVRRRTGIPHKMIKAFLQLANGNVTAGVRYDALRHRCQQDGVANFDNNNFDRMKVDRIYTFGRVFVRDGDMVRIVPEMQGAIRQYINQFMAN